MTFDFVLRCFIMHFFLLILFEICVKHVFSVDMNICVMFYIFVFINNFFISQFYLFVL